MLHSPHLDLLFNSPHSSNKQQLVAVTMATTATASAIIATASSSSLVIQGPGLAGSSSSQLALARIPSARPLSARVLGNEKRIMYRQQRSNCGLVVYAEYSGRRGGGAGDFVAGFLLGGALFGAIGYLIAPTVNKTLAAAAEKEKSMEDGVEDEGPPKKLPKFLEDDEGLEVRNHSEPLLTKLMRSLEDKEGREQKTRKSLNEKIAQLNAAIDDVSAQLRADEGAFSNVNDSAVELESAA